MVHITVISVLWRVRQEDPKFQPILLLHSKFKGSLGYTGRSYLTRFPKKLEIKVVILVIKMWWFNYLFKVVITETRL